MALPAVHNFDLYRGDTYWWEFVLWQDEDKTIPVDLTMVTPFAQIRSDANAATAANLTCALASANSISVRLPVAAWTDIATLKNGVWDLQLTFDSGEVRTILAGVVTITADVTKVMP